MGLGLGVLPRGPKRVRRGRMATSRIAREPKPPEPRVAPPSRLVRLPRRLNATRMVLLGAEAPATIKGKGPALTVVAWRNGRILRHSLHRLARSTGCTAPPVGPTSIRAHRAARRLLFRAAAIDAITWHFDRGSGYRWSRGRRSGWRTSRSYAASPGRGTNSIHGNNLTVRAFLRGDRRWSWSVTHAL